MPDEVSFTVKIIDATKKGLTSAGNSIKAWSNKAKSSLSGFSSGLKSFSAGLWSFTKKFTVGVIAVGTAIGFAIKKAFNEQFTRKYFDVLFKNTKKAEDYFNKVEKFSELKPFSKDDIQDAARAILRMSAAELDSIATLEMLGDAAVHAEVNIKELADIYGTLYKQAQRGRPVERSIKAFSEMGLLSEVAAKKLERLSGRTRNFAKIMSMVDEELLKTKGGMKDFANTGNVALITLKDKIDDIIESFGMGFLGIDPKSVNSVDRMTKVVQELGRWLGDNEDKFREWGATIRSIADGLLPILKSVADIIQPLAKGETSIAGQAAGAMVKEHPVASGLIGGSAAIGALSGLITIYEKLSKVIKGFGKAGRGIGEAGKALGDAAKGKTITNEAEAWRHYQERQLRKGLSPKESDFDLKKGMKIDTPLSRGISRTGKAIGAGAAFIGKGIAASFAAAPIAFAAVIAAAAGAAVALGYFRHSTTKAVDALRESEKALGKQKKIAEAEIGLGEGPSALRMRRHMRESLLRRMGDTSTNPSQQAALQEWSNLTPSEQAASAFQLNETLKTLSENSTEEVVLLDQIKYNMSAQ